MNTQIAETGSAGNSVGNLPAHRINNDARTSDDNSI